MVEPNLIFQSGEEMTPDERRVWIMKGIEGGRAKGCGFFRASFEPEHKLTLLECWQIPPDDQGEPRFQMVSLS